MKDVTITAQQKKNMRDGVPFNLTYQGTTYRITPYLYAYAKSQIASGAGQVVLLPEVVGNGMEQIVVTL